MRILAALVAAGLIVFACGETDGDEDTTDTAAADSGEPGETDSGDPAGSGTEEPPVGAGTVAIEVSASAVMGATITALNSAADGAQFGTLGPETLTPGTLAIQAPSSASLTQDDGDDNNGDGNDSDGDNTPSEANPNCGGNGTPFSDAGEQLLPGDAGFILKSFYCLLNDKNSPDVVLGAIGITRGFICMAEKQEGFAYSAEGTTVSVSFANVLAEPVAQECFPPEVLASAENESEREGGDGGQPFVADFTGYLLADGPWSHRIQMVDKTPREEGDDHSEPENTFFVVTETAAAYKRGDISASLDFANGVLRFENMETLNTRHTRLQVKGELEATGAFTSVSAIEGIQTQGLQEVLTARGAPATGFVYNSYRYDCSDCSDPDSENDGIVKITGGTWRHLGSECLGTGDSCDRTQGIEFSTDADVPYAATSFPDLLTNQIEPWRANHPPLCYETVSKDLIPTPTCDFGPQP